MKHSNNVAQDRRVSIQTARGRWFCQHLGGLGQESNEMANPGELSINVVIAEQAKGADKLEPKGTVVGTGAEVSPVTDKITTGGKREPSSFLAVE